MSLASDVLCTHLDFHYSDSEQLVTNMDSLFTETLLLWENGTERSGALRCCLMTAGLSSGMCLTLVTDGRHRLKIWISVHNYCNVGNRVSAVGTATGYGLDHRGVEIRVPVGAWIFSMSSRPFLWATQSPIQRVPGALSPGVNRPKR
jgi:hypothetical protein